MKLEAGDLDAHRISKFSTFLLVALNLGIVNASGVDLTVLGLFTVAIGLG